MTALSAEQAAYVADLRLRVLSNDPAHLGAHLELIKSARDGRISAEDTRSILDEKSRLRAYRRAEHDRIVKTDYCFISIGDVIKPHSRDLSARRISPSDRANIEPGKSALYFVSAPLAKLIKIGVTKTLQSRLIDLAGASPLPLVFLGACAGDSGLERKLHLQFKALRSHAEWFRDDPTIRAEFAKLYAESPHPAVVRQMERNK